MKTHPRIGFAVALASAFCLLTGCSKEKNEPRMDEVTGTIENIGAKTVTVRSFSKKHNKELTYDVQVDSETEILINGSLASISDLKIGEAASGSVRIVEKDKDQRIITAVKVRVERAEVLKAPGAGDSDDKESKENDDAPSEDDGDAGIDDEDDGE